jgi:acetylornithine/N-succinyldiaminopimelate aminotransferase
MLVAGPSVLRFVPSLVIPNDVLDEGLARFEKAVEQVLAAQEATAR